MRLKYLLAPVAPAALEGCDDRRLEPHLDAHGLPERPDGEVTPLQEGPERASVRLAQPGDLAIAADRGRVAVVPQRGVVTVSTELTLWRLRADRPALAQDADPELLAWALWQNLAIYREVYPGRGGALLQFLLDQPWTPRPLHEQRARCAALRAASSQLRALDRATAQLRERLNASLVAQG